MENGAKGEQVDIRVLESLLLAPISTLGWVNIIRFLNGAKGE